MTGGLARGHARQERGRQAPDRQAPDRQAPDRLVPGSQMSASQRSAAAIVGALSAAGTRLLFGIPGGGPNLDVVGAAAASGLRFILAHGETAATIMAATCADLTGAPGAVVVTRGPGLASAVNGIAHAALDRLPLVVIADTVPAADSGRISHQRLDQAALGRSVAKAAVTVGGGHPEQAANHAVGLAAAPPPGPVVVNVDADVRDILLQDDDLGALPPDDDLAPLIAALRTARRPAVLLGPGAVRHTGAVRAALVGSGIPALHSYRARGIVPDSAAEAAGLFTGGTMESPLLTAADLIVGLGVDPVELIPAPWDYPAPAVLVTDVPAGSAGYFSGGLELVTSLPAAIAALAAHGVGHGWPEAAGTAAKMAAAGLLQRAATVMPGRLTPQEVVTTVRAHTPPGTIATVDAGAHMLVAMPLWPVDEPRRLLISSGLATMGFALPAAIAAALCVPGEPVIAFTGDGGLGMALMEIETAVRHRLRIVLVVFNDATLSLIKIKQFPAGQGGADTVGYRPVSFAPIAAAMGAAAASVTDVAGLVAALARALGRAGPTLIDARVDPAGYPAVMDLTRGAAGRRGAPE
ncbi:MAG TPA: thiamine pyrophosphate-dependent enzyme [Streptosporangiaceae bacterium]